jgi:ABC-2 type transport system permease protein
MLNEFLAAVGFTIAEIFSSFVNGMIAIMAAIAAIVLVSRVKSEESAILAELIAATPVSRYMYLVGFVLISFITAALMQLLFAVGLYQAAAATLENPDALSLRFVIEAAMIYVPAQWVMIGLTVLLIGLKPRITGVVWVYLGYCFLLEFMGRVGVFPDWIMNTTPFGFVPQLPFEETSLTVLGVLTLTALVLTAAGFFFYNRRDLNAVTN